MKSKISSLVSIIWWATLLCLASPALSQSENLALNSTAMGSTEDLPASNAVDGDGSTRWASAAQTDPSYITLDLGQAFDLSSVVIVWEAANAQSYEIRGSNDNASWTTLASFSGGTFGGRTDNLAVSGSYRYVQMYGISRPPENEWGYSIWEFEVYGTAASQGTVFQAEDYSSFFDTTAGNTGGAYRSDDVDIEATSDEGGGFNVGWIEATEWLAYDNLSIPTSGTYTIKMRVASPNGASASVDLNGGTIQLGSASIPATGGWQSWTTVSFSADINAGTYSRNCWVEFQLDRSGIQWWEHQPCATDME